jgi:hypothetical protein
MSKTIGWGKNKNKSLALKKQKMLFRKEAADRPGKPASRPAEYQRRVRADSKPQQTS